MTVGCRSITSVLPYIFQSMVRLQSVELRTDSNLNLTLFGRNCNAILSLAPNEHQDQSQEIFVAGIKSVNFIASHYQTNIFLA